MPEPTETEMVTFTLDGRELTAKKGSMIIAAAEEAGTYIPRFCYHPRMEPVGNCRMCLVDVEGPRGSTLVPSCFVSVTDGMVVTSESEKVKKAQDGVLELLLTNHPLDCPVCDKGGECPLQDQTLTHGPGETRFVEEKRHFEKPIPISELVLLDRERCIQCSRCTRFADEVAGEALIDFAGRGDRVEVATFPGEPFSSYFSGNTVQICPVGALTATPYRFAARPWDLEQVESTCTGCSVGCRVAVQSSAGRLTRLLGVDTDPVNHSWLCDKGRFLFEAVNGPEEGNEELALTDVTRRLTEPMVRKDGELVSTSWGEALKAAAAIIREATEQDPGALGAIGGAQLTNEGAFAWASLLKGVVGTDSVDAQLGDGLDAVTLLGLPRATIDEAAAARTLVVLSGDLREEVPVLFLRLRAGAQAKRTSIVDLGPRSSSISELAAVRLPARPGDAAVLARALGGDLSSLSSVTSHPEGRTFSDDDLETAQGLIGDDGAGVVIVLGRTSLAEDPAFVEAAARSLHGSFPKATFLPVLRRANVFGALDMGLSPGILPGRVALGGAATSKPSSWPVVPTAKGRSTLEQLAAMAEGSQKALVVLGADPTTDVADAALVEQAFSHDVPLVAIAGHGGPILAHADVVLPSTVMHERGGTTTNLEGRVSRLGQKVVPTGQAWADWMIAAELAAELGADLGVTTTEEVTDQIARLAPSHAGIDRARLERADAIDGVLVPLSRTQASISDRVVDPMAVPGLSGPVQVGLGSYAGVVRSEHASSIEASGTLLSAVDLEGETGIEAPSPDSYALRLVVTRTLYDQGTFVSASPSLAALRQSSVVKAHPYDLDRLGATDGSEVTLRSAQATVVASVIADDGVLKGTVVIDTGLASSAAGASLAATLLSGGDVVTEVRMESR